MAMSELVIWIGVYGVGVVIGLFVTGYLSIRTQWSRDTGIILSVLWFIVIPVMLVLFVLGGMFGAGRYLGEVEFKRRPNKHG